MLVDGFFFWEWSPNWLDPRINDLMMWIDPSGFRWLNETWLKVDRGVRFYNTAPIPLDRVFSISRVVLVALGFLAVALSQLSSRRGTPRRDLTPHGSPGRRCSEPRTIAVARRPSPSSLAALGMTTARPACSPAPGKWRGSS